MKNVCLCITKQSDEVHSIGILDSDGKYYSDEAGGWLDTNHALELFYYIELTWEEFKKIINRPEPKCPELTYGVELKDRDYRIRYPISFFHGIDWPDREIKPTCKLDNGEIIQYDACSDGPNAYDPKKFKYVGEGEIDTVNGYKQTAGWRKHFYLRIY